MRQRTVLAAGCCALVTVVLLAMAACTTTTTLSDPPGWTRLTSPWLGYSIALPATFGFDSHVDRGEYQQPYDMFFGTVPDSGMTMMLAVGSVELVEGETPPPVRADVRAGDIAFEIGEPEGEDQAGTTLVAAGYSGATRWGFIADTSNDKSTKAFFRQVVATFRPPPPGFVEPSPSPSPTAVPRAEVETKQVALKTWLADGGATAFELIVEVVNPTDDYITIGGDVVDVLGYSIKSKDGDFMIGGVLDGPYPPVIAPGAKGYLFAAHTLHGGDSADSVGRAVPDIYATVADGPVELLQVSDLKLVPATTGDGLEVAGVVTNNSSEAVPGVTIAAVFFDGSGKLIGGVCDEADGLAPGAVSEFQTDYRGTPPLNASEVATYEVWAFDADLGFCLEVLSRD